jgi:fatty acid desaturase
VIGVSLWLLTTHFSWWLAPILSLVIGHSFACLGFVAHDICHGSSVQTPVLRDFLAGLGFSAFGIGPYLWRRWHNSDHHNNTQVEGIDPDHLFTMEDYKDNPILRGLYKLSPLARNLIIFSSFTYRMTQQTIRMMITYLKSPKSTNWNRFVLIVQFLVPISLWVALTLSLGTQVFWWGYFVPLLVGNAIAISYIATNHFLNPLADDRDVLATSLTVTHPKWLSWLDALHSHFGAHVAHHLFPQAPARYGRQIEAKIAELFPDRYHTMPMWQALVLLWKTPWIYEDKETLIDPHRQIRHKTLGRGLAWLRRRKSKAVVEAKN